MRYPLFAIMVIVLSAAQAAYAQDKWLRKKFMPRADAKLKVRAQEIAPDQVLLPYFVTEVNGDWLWIGKAWVQKKHVVPLNAALDYYTSYLRTHPNSSWAYNMRGISRSKTLFGDKSKKQASADFSAAIRVDPNNRAAYFNRADLRAGLTKNPLFIEETMVLGEDEDVAKAVDDYSAAIRLDASFTYAYYHRAHARMKLDLKDPQNKAINDLTKALQLGLKSADVEEAYISRGDIWFEKKQYDNAITDYSEMIRRFPKHDTPYYRRAKVWKAKGNLDKAIADYTALIRMNAKDERAFLFRGNARLEKGDDTKAASDFAEAMRLDPYFAKEKRDWGADAANYGAYEYAISNLNDAIHLDPKFANAYNSRAWLYATCPEAKYRDGKQAIADAQKACELTGWKNFSFIDTLAAAYAEHGDFKEAMRWQEKVIELAPNNKKDKFRAKLKLFKSGKPYRQTRKK